MPRLAGRKRYPPRWQEGHSAGALGGIQAMGEAQLQRVRDSSSGKPASKDVQSTLKFLMPRAEGRELTFSSTIRLHNVTAAELGAVLFALTHGGDPAKPFRHMVGRAKPFGAGQLRVAAARLSLVPNDRENSNVKAPEPDEIADAEGRSGFCPPPNSGENAARNASHRPFLAAFIDRMCKEPALAAFPDVPAVREFLGSCDPGEAAKLSGCLDYLPLADFKALRQVTQPLKHQNGYSGAPPHRFAEESPDGRLLAAPATSHTPWRK